MTAAERQRRYRKKHPKRENVAWQRYAHSDKGTATLLLNYANDRARSRELPFELDREWLLPKLQKNTCELTGLSFVREQSKEYRIHPFAPSIDKIDPKLGYTKENSRLICFCVNRAKSDWGDEILMAMAQALVKGITI